MDETKVQIGEDVVLDIGTHSDWYISAVGYNGESVNVDLRRKADRYKVWGLAGTPQTERMTEEEFDTMLAKVLVGQTESTGSPIGDYRDGVGAWQTDCEDRYAIRTDSGEVVAHACPLGCEQTDCGWK